MQVCESSQSSTKFKILFSDGGDNVLDVLSSIQCKKWNIMSETAPPGRLLHCIGSSTLLNTIALVL